MNSTINQAFRQRILKGFLEDVNGAKAVTKNMYLIFSYEATRSTQDTLDISEAPITSVHGDTNVTGQLAVRLSSATVSNILKFAVKSAVGDVNVVKVDGINYFISDTMTDLTRLWSSIYFNMNVKQAASTPFNIVSVVTNLKLSGNYVNTATIGAAALATIDWSEAEILMQSRPATDNLIEAKYIQFPGLITF